jgi:D-sedoheptulose 7-phosphate isomerase
MTSVNFESYIADMNDVLTSIDETTLTDIESILTRCNSSGGSIWVIGNGGAAATAAHFVVDFNKTVRGFNGITARTFSIPEMTTLVSAVANDISYEESFSEPLRLLAKREDVLIALSVSGTSPNIVRAVKEANALGVYSIGIFGLNGIVNANTCYKSLVIDSIDYQIVENAHVVVMHWLTKILGKEQP